MIFSSLKDKEITVFLVVVVEEEVAVMWTVS
jgi:hypothetical protein